MVGFSRASMILLIATGILANPPQRVGKNLSGVFPFNTNNGHGAHHGDHGHHGNHQAHQPFNPRDSRQGSGAGGDASTDLASIRAELYRPPRERCIDKVVMVEETEYDDVETCKHSYSEKCYTTYVTDFEPAQEEECEETFTKRCFIEYKKVASDETVTFCHTPTLLVGDGADVCTTVTESYCKTHYHEHNVLDDVVKCETILEEKCEDVTQGYTTSTKCTKWPRQVCTKTPTDVKKYTPQTDCEPIPRKVCGRGNRQVPGKEECFDKKETVIQEVPEETCSLEPQRTCRHVTKLVPFLKPAEVCVDIPKEVCSRSRTNPRKVQKPMIKKWCYDPSQESGLE